MIEITLDSESVMSGGFLAGNVRWSSDAVHRIVVSAEWHAAAFNGTKQRAARAVAYTPRGGERQGAFPVRLLIPHEGPVSFDGQLIEIGWSLTVRIERRGLDEIAERAFRVVPRRKLEVRKAV